MCLCTRSLNFLQFHALSVIGSAAEAPSHGCDAVPDAMPVWSYVSSLSPPRVGLAQTVVVRMYNTRCALRGHGTRHLCAVFLGNVSLAFSAILLEIAAPFSESIDSFTSTVAVHPSGTVNHPPSFVGSPVSGYGSFGGKQWVSTSSYRVSPEMEQAGTSQGSVRV